MKILNNISKIRINLDNTLALKDIPFCYRYNDILNPDKNYILEKYAIFSSKFQINIITKSTQIFIDGTFKIAPIRFYQVLIIGGYVPEINGIIPLFFIPTTGKSEYLYNKIFCDIKNIFIENKIDYKKIADKYMLDFEKSLQNAIRKNFEGVKIRGCYFHYVKKLLEKAKRFGLCIKVDI